MLLLDIDDVLIDWTPTNHHMTSAHHFGFPPESWIRPGWRFFEWYNPNQLWKIRQSFPEIWWHTTWSFGNQSNRRFARKTDFGERKNLMADYGDTTHHHDIDPPEYSQGWWKLDAFVEAVEHGTLDSHAKIVWADNDILQSLPLVENTLQEMGMSDRVRLEHPQVFWSLEEIEMAHDWLLTHTPGRGTL